MTEILLRDGYFHLRNERISYVMRVVGGSFLMHVYFGRRLRSLHGDVLRRFADVSEADFSRRGCLPDRLPQEMPSFGYGDMRPGALSVQGPDGARTVGLEYRACRVLDQKPALPGLPATFDQDGASKTLVLTLADPVLALTCELFYTIFDDCDVVARHMTLRNDSGAPLVLEQAMSASLDLPRCDLELLTLSGAWSRERRMDRRMLCQGEQGVSSLRGASGLQQSPFLAVMTPGTDETHGDVTALTLMYSGNFRAQAVVDQFGQARLMIGLNDADFSWQLGPGETFTTPEAELCFSSEGLGGMSRSFHRLCARHVVRGAYAAARRPILLNNWEATYFGFDERKLLSIAQRAASFGVELFVLDDGWFGHRDDDHTSLGDWTEDRRKLPEGLEGLSRKIHQMGLKFGLWFEPEMVSVDSDLYRAHPDWCLHVAGRERVEFRNQLILDMSRPEVCEHVYEAVASVLSRGGIDYVKWDMNRNFSPVGSPALAPARQKELPHRYMLGLYGVLEKLTARFPQVLFESCASGGGRFDLGMLYYMPQTWCSDDTDAAERCRIQYGTSLVFPPFSMGAHISAVPNHQTGRVTPLKTRSDVAMGGTYGYELDVTKLPEEEIAQLSCELARVKSVRDTLLYGELHRLCSPYDSNYTAWITVSPDRREAVLVCVRMMMRTQSNPDAILLRGLDPDRDYRLAETGEIFGGDELMRFGLAPRFPNGDYQSCSFILRAVDAE